MLDAMKNSIVRINNAPAQFETVTYNEAEKSAIVSYMKSFAPDAVAGMVYDCVSGERTKMENLGYSDGSFFWCSQDIYHIQHYNAAVSEAFYKTIIC